MSYDLRLQRLYEAAPEAAFDAFTDADAQRELYADSPDWTVTSECDLRVGGQWRIAFGPPGQDPAVETNVFTIVDRPRLLAYNSTMRLPDGTTLDTLMRVTFDEEDRPKLREVARNGGAGDALIDGCVVGLGRLSKGAASAVTRQAVHRSRSLAGGAASAG